MENLNVIKYMNKGQDTLQKVVDKLLCIICNVMMVLPHYPK